MRFGALSLACAAVVAIVLAPLSGADAARKKQSKQDDAPSAQAADKRDRVVTIAGSPFNGRPYWQAAAQCGGTYFKLNTILADAAITAKVIKPDPAAFTRLSQEADDASATATRFFDAAERFLTADRKLARDQAILVYDGIASRTGDRFKSAEAASQAAKPCPEFYKACRAAHPQICNDTLTLTN